jgi:hypothetical protein
MNQVRPIIVVWIFALTFSACVGGKAIERSYFSIQYVLGESDRLYSEAPIPQKLQINRFAAAIAYDRQEPTLMNFGITGTSCGPRSLRSWFGSRS